MENIQTYVKTENIQTYVKTENIQTYVKTDNNRIINENCIKWVEKMGECLALCTKSSGCNGKDTHKICKINNLDSYNKLNKHYD